MEQAGREQAVQGLGQLHGVALQLVRPRCHQTMRPNDNGVSLAIVT